VAAKTVDELTIHDFDVVGYFHHGTLKGKMSV
jgi:thymidylate synthase